MKKAQFIGGGKPEERHAVLGNGQIYCEWQGAASAPVITHSGVKCEFCRKTLAGLHYVGGVSSNPHYIGLDKKTRERKHFVATGKVTEKKYGKIYGAVVGPFKTEKEAWKKGGYAGNPVPSYAMILRRKLAKGHSQEEAEELARRELQQANIFLSEGWKKNPLRKNGPVKIYGQTEKIFMKKTAGPYKGQKFVHDFKGGVRQIGMPRGTVVRFPDGRTARLTTRSVLLDGKKALWRNFAA